MVKDYVTTGYCVSGAVTPIADYIEKLEAENRIMKEALNEISSKKDYWRSDPCPKIADQALSKLSNKNKE